jgi:demethylmenaquinone methyltransferase / 2-methoxy-6-polyprenyl-1,4-benzoquinol methylase
MFDGIVDRYDLLNRLISLGMDRQWRRAAVAAIEAGPDARVLDLGCGTGDLSRLLLEQTPRRPPIDADQGSGDPRALADAALARVVGLDVSQRMLRRARQRLGPRVALVRGSAFELPFAAAAFRGVVSAFVLRNLRDLEGALAELARVLAPGGRIALLDATEPPGFLRPAFDVYFRLAAPALGALAGQRNAYQYLASSLVQIPSRAEMCRLLANAGFVDCAARPLTLGAVTLFTGRRAP